MLFYLSYCISQYNEHSYRASRGWRRLQPMAEAIDGDHVSGPYEEISSEILPTKLWSFRPNILAFNLATSINISLALLLVFMIICGGLLYYFMRSTSLCCRLGISEGLQEPLNLKSNWGLVIATFILTVLYLPLSTMAMHVLVWSEDLWVVPNPYVNATTNPPIVTPLGPENEFRDPLDFCWTTTMKRNEINFAPIVVIIAIICLAAVSIRACKLCYSTDDLLDDCLVSYPSASGGKSSRPKGWQVYGARDQEKSKWYGSWIPTVTWSGSQSIELLVQRWVLFALHLVYASPTT